jgi:hypothetical protein
VKTISCALSVVETQISEWLSICSNPAIATVGTTLLMISRINGKLADITVPHGVLDIAVTNGLCDSIVLFSIWKSTYDPFGGRTGDTHMNPETIPNGLYHDFIVYIYTKNMI